MSCSFVVDAMLGTLAKWLRILGYDAIYDPGLDDYPLMRLARAENRVLLTRDRELAQRRGVRTLLIESQVLDEQLQQVVSELNLEPTPSFSRCPVCNGALAPLDRQVARSLVPAYVAKTQERFRRCPGCGRVYWQGSHWQQIEERLEALQSKDK
jgi:uncharacterized protein with PIN domain